MQKSTGIIFVIISMLFFGLNPVYSYLFIQKFDPLIFGGITCLFGAIPLMFMIQKKGHGEYLFKKTIVSSQLILIIVLSTISFYFFFVGAKLTSGINTALLSQIEPLYGTLLAVIILKETLQKSEIIALTILFVGSIILVFDGFTPPNIGDIFILLSPLFAQLSHIVSKRIIHKLPDPTIIPAARLFYSGIFFISLGIILNPSSIVLFLNVQVLFSFLIFALLFRTAVLFFWYQALEKLPASKAAAFLPIALVIAFIGTIFVLHETPNLRHYLGLAAILGGTLWITVLHLKPTKA